MPVKGRATFIVDPKGVIRHSSINDFAIAHSVDDVIRVIEALQFSEKHGKGISSIAA